MLRLLVTGGSGLLGSAVVRHLRACGHEVLSADRVPPPDRAGRYKLVDIEDIGQVYSVVRGMDAVVHLAAIPRPQYDAPEVVFRTNTMAMFNVMEAAAAFGVPRVIYASSISVLGFPFFTQPLSPAYLPIDEDHPRLPQDAYALSKALGEEIAAAFVRRQGGALTVISLRYPWIHTPESFAEQIVPLWNQPAPDAAANLFSYVDARDAAESVRLALEAPMNGHEAFFISARDSFMPQESAALAAAHFPTAEIRAGLTGHASLLSTRKAAQALGFAAQHSWRDYGVR